MADQIDTAGLLAKRKAKEDRGWSVYPRGDDGQWCVSFRVSRGVWRDRRIPHAEAHTEPQAEKWVRANIARLRAGEPAKVDTKPEVIRVRDVTEEFLKIRGKSGLRPATRAQDKSVIETRILPALGDVPVAALDIKRLLEFFDDLRAKNVGRSMFAKTHSTLRSFLDTVKARQLAPIVSNPTRDLEFMGQLRMKKQRRKRGSKVTLAISVVEQLLTAKNEKGDVVPLMWRVRDLLGCLAGLRDGEIAGLKWEDLDLDANIPTIHVRFAVALMGEEHRVELGPTKNEGSERDIPIHPETLKALKAWKALGWAQHVGHHPKAHDFVLPNAAGEAWRPKSAEQLREHLIAAKCAAKVGDKNVTFHALRRSFATWLAVAGVERSTRKKLMGHEDGDVDEAHYIERDLLMLQKAVQSIHLDLSKPTAKVIAFPGKTA